MAVPLIRSPRFRFKWKEFIRFKESQLPPSKTSAPTAAFRSGCADDPARRLRPHCSTSKHTVVSGQAAADPDWDYSRDADIGGGHTAKEFGFVEMNAETG
jgi:hypothetical protein